MNNEIKNIFERYQRRENSELVEKNSNFHTYNNYVNFSKEKIMGQIIDSKFEEIETIRFLEIGAGYGFNLYFFNRLGIKWENIYANELLPERVEALQTEFPKIGVLKGDASEISGQETFEIVFQSIVFTSILDNQFKQKLAKKMWSMTKLGGIVLWYDFIYDNPRNPDVKGVGKKEIEKLFPDSTNIKFYKTTVAPPLGRRIGKLYPFFDIFPFLRTHMVAVIHK